MRAILSSMFAVLILMACSGNSQKSTEQPVQADQSTVFVYYFHGKQRCKTCVAVEEVTTEFIKEAYSGNSKVKYVEVNIGEGDNEALIEKYEVTWNALIIAKADNHTDITKEAFETAVSSPQTLTELIEAEINKRLE